MIKEFASLDAVAQAHLVRQGHVHPLELVDTAIQQIERFNPQLNAVITPLFAKAREQAKLATDKRAAGPFHGVPLLLKDFFCHTAGDPYYEGMRFLRDRHWCEPQDTYLAAKLRAAGFLFLGKTNLPELAGLATTDSAAFGPTRNPWDLARSPGGSSGGSAAAVAAGMTAVAHANDGTGSIRIPASACGVVGLKPSRGRVSAGPARMPGLLGNIVEHVITRSVRDTAAILDAIAGPMPGDLFRAPPPLRPYWQEVGQPVERLRIGLLVEDVLLQLPVGAECVAAVQATGKLFESLGHSVEEAFPPALLGPTGLGEALRIVSTSSLAARLDLWSARTGQLIGPDDVEPHIWRSAEQGRSYRAVQVHEAIQRLVAGVMRVPEWWADFDLLLTPTMQQVPPRIDELRLDQQGAIFGLFTMPYSITGQPAISLPLYWSEAGLPVGVQLVADYGREDLLIRVSSLLEAAQPWAEKRPPILA